MSDPGRAEQAMDGDQHDETSGRQGASSIKSPALAGAGRFAAGRRAQNPPDTADFAGSAVLAFANALPSGVAFNFALGRPTSETAVASARSRDTVSLGAGYFDLAPSMGSFEYDDSGRSGTYQETEVGKDHHEDDEFPHLASSRKPGGMTWSVMHERRGPWERTPGPEVGGAESTPGYEKSPVAAFRPLVVVAYASITVLLPRDQAKSTARRLRSASEQWTRAALCVARRTTRGAWPASNASCQRDAHKHQRSPGFRPGKPNWGIGVERSLPRDLEKSRNARASMPNS